MSVEERDKYTGHLTTGHDWNGIKELNTRVPRIVLICLAMAFIFSLGYWYLLPAWPLGKSYTPGKLNIDQKEEVTAQLLEAGLQREKWASLVRSSTFDVILESPELMAIVEQSGPALFADNCAMCHGQQGEGGLYFPNLSDSAWLWGGSPEQIHKTLKVGINAGVEGTRVAQMPAFGSTGLLDSSEIDDVATYLQSLSSDQIGDGSRAEEMLSIGRGNTVFKTNCAACHGANAQGNTALGAPNLADNIWLYGGDKQAIVQTLVQGRGGLMPAWQGRLNEVELKLLSIYVAGLANGGEASVDDFPTDQ